jgi:hypothetical protein
MGKKILFATSTRHSSLCSSFLDQNIGSLKMLSGMKNYCYFSLGDDSSL